MTRDQGLLYVVAEFGYLGDLFALAATDDVITGWGVTLDAALRELRGGLLPEDPDTYEVLPQDEAHYLALLDYFALRTIDRKAAAKVDIRLGQPEIRKSYSQLATQVADRLKLAREHAQTFGFLSTMQALDLNLDFVAPRFLG